VAQLARHPHQRPLTVEPRLVSRGLTVSSFLLYEPLSFQHTLGGDGCTMRKGDATLSLLEYAGWLLSATLMHQGTRFAGTRLLRLYVLLLGDKCNEVIILNYKGTECNKELLSIK
jgi:hypothetical protein